jgi:hypothetical protein
MAETMKPVPISDGQLVEAMFHPDSGIARIAKQIYDERRVAVPHDTECLERELPRSTE